MKVIVAGCRDYSDYEYAEKILDHYLSAKAKREEIEIVSGRCDRGVLTFITENDVKVYGADGLGERYAHVNGFKVTPFPAKWKELGRFAGPKRNCDMAIYCSYGDALIAFWDGQSKGTSQMIQAAKDRGLIVKVITIKIKK